MLLQVVLAFLIFDHAEDKELVCKAYKSSLTKLGRRWQREGLRFQGHKGSGWPGTRTALPPPRLAESV